MNFGDFLHSKRWKLIQNYIYSWGASVVLIGALAKLEHYEIASVLLGVGLSIEAIIFFISAFEPMMELPDWKKVYPQLRTNELKDKELAKLKELDDQFPDFFGGGSGSKGAGEVSIKDIPKEQIDKLNQSFKKIAEVAEGIQDISNATSATNNFVTNLNNASSSIGQVVEANQKVSDEMGKSVEKITQSYSTAAADLKTSSEQVSDGIKQSVNQLHTTTEKASAGINEVLTELSSTVKNSAESLKESNNKISQKIETTGNNFANDVKATTDDMAKSYQKMTSSFAGGFSNFEKSSQDFVNKVEQLNKNMAALNTAYELHLQGANKVEQVVNEYQNGVSEIGKLLTSSIEETRKFNSNTKEFNNNIQELNKVYGNMLSALNVIKK